MFISEYAPFKISSDTIVFGHLADFRSAIWPIFPLSILRLHNAFFSFFNSFFIKMCAIEKKFVSLHRE